MTKKQAMKYWFESAKNNIKVAQGNFQIKHYDWTLFFWHLVLEKPLKGRIIASGKTPLATHDLVKLAKLADINLTSDDKAVLKEVNSFNFKCKI